MRRNEHNLSCLEIHLDQYILNHFLLNHGHSLKDKRITINPAENPTRGNIMQIQLLVMSN